MHIRPYEESDEQQVVSLWREVLGYDSPHNEPGITLQRKLAFQRELFFVAVIDESVVGTVMGGYDGHRGWIYSLAVDPESRRRGIGKALMAHVEGALLELGCPKINLQIYSANHEVVAFYEALGYGVEERISMGKRLR